MRILRIIPDRTGGAIVARFDVELTDDIRMYGLTLRQTKNGHRSDVPNIHGRHVVTFTPHVAQQITDAALAALKELNANVVIRNAA